MGIICGTCGDDIDAKNQDNMGLDEPLCEDCANEIRNGNKNNMELNETKTKRRPSIVVRCPGCGTHDVWYHLPKKGDVCHRCGYAFESFEWKRGAQ
jgi:protein-arginine kinase activator protein McsA